MAKKDMGSVFGVISSASYNRIHIIEKELNKRLSVLVLDALDGLCVIPFAKSGNSVDCYETEKVYIDGGEINGFKILYGLKDKLEYYELSNNTNIINNNFFNEKNNKQYDFVYVNKCINYDKYNDITMDKKIKKILKSVNLNGYLFLSYYLAINEKDYNNYPKNQFTRRGEMIKYFGENWEVLSMREDYKLTKEKPNPIHPLGIEYVICYIFAKKINNNKKYIYHYNYVPLLSVKFEEVDLT